MNNSTSAIDRERFNEEGYAIVRRLAPTALCSRMLHVARSDLARAAPPIEYEADTRYPGAPRSHDAPGGRTARRLLQAYTRDAAFREWSTSHEIAQQLQIVLEPELELSQAHHNCIMTKAPAYSSVTGWHRDIRYWSFERPELVSVWLALGAERRENGCLLVLPGSHRMEFEPECLDEAQFLRADVERNRELLSRQTAVELDPGDVLFFHCRLFHAAGNNQTGQTKFSVVFTYHSADNAPVPGTRSASLPDIPLST
jgi:phytanoyl-CoA hydroxylase